jgi:hypothetical protein
MSLIARAIHPVARLPDLIPIGGVIDKGPRGIGRKFAHRAHQAVVNHHLTKLETISKDAATAFTGGNNENIFKIKQDATGRQTKQTFRFKITESGGSAAMVLAPVWRWFDRIEFEPLKNKEQQLRLYGDNLEELLRLACSDEDCKSLARNCNFNAGNDVYYNGAAQTHKASEAKWYSMPLHSFFDQMHVNPRMWKTDYQIKFYCKNGIIISGSGVPSFTDIELICEIDHDDHNVPHEDHHGKLMLQHVPLYDFYEPQIVEEQSVTVTASSKYRVNLDAVRGQCGFMTVRVRSSTANASSASMNNVDLGPNALFDIEDSNQKSQWSNGINGDYILFNQCRQWFPNNYCGKSYLYVLGFCDNPMDAMYHGVTRGYLDIQAKKFLAITPDAAPVSWVYTVVTSNSTDNDGGTIAFSDPLGNRTADLAFNTTAANLKVALDALPFFVENGLTSTFSATAINDFTITIAGRDLSLMEGKSIGVFSKLTQSTNVTGITSVTATTVGRRGFTTGTYTITVYCYTHKQLADLGYALSIVGGKQ